MEIRPASTIGNIIDMGYVDAGIDFGKEFDTHL